MSNELMSDRNGAAFDYSFAFDWVYLEPARSVLSAMTARDQDEFTSLVADQLCLDPWEDGERKIALPLDDGTLVTLYDDGHWQVIYLLVASRVIEIWALSKDWFGAN